MVVIWFHGRSVAGDEPPRTVVCGVCGVPHSSYSSRLQEEKKKGKCSRGSMCHECLVDVFIVM